MNKHCIEGNENQLPENTRDGKEPPRWLHAIKGLFVGMSGLIRGEADFYYLHESEKPDGSKKKTILRWRNR